MVWNFFLSQQVVNETNKPSCYTCWPGKYDSSGVVDELSQCSSVERYRKCISPRPLPHIHQPLRSLPPPHHLHKPSTSLHTLLHLMTPSPAFTHSHSPWLLARIPYPPHPTLQVIRLLHLPSLRGSLDEACHLLRRSNQLRRRCHGCHGELHGRGLFTAGEAANGEQHNAGGMGSRDVLLMPLHLQPLRLPPSAVNA